MTYYILLFFINTGINPGVSEIKKKDYTLSADGTWAKARTIGTIKTI